MAYFSDKPSPLILNKRIGIDGLNLCMPNGTGVARYARTLICRLAEMNSSPLILNGLDFKTSNKNSFLNQLKSPFLTPFPKFPEYKWWVENFYNIIGKKSDFISPIVLPMIKKDDLTVLEKHFLSFTISKLYNSRNLFRAAAGFFRTTGKFVPVNNIGVDIMHWTYPVPLYMKHAYNIYTIHDIIPLTHPQTTLDNKPYYYKLIKNVLKKSDAIVTVSETSKNEILSFFPDIKYKIFNFYQSIESNSRLKNTFNSKEESEKIFKQYNLISQKYFFFCGALEPKKNIARLIEAHLSINTDIPLVIINGRSWQYEDIETLILKAEKIGKLIKLDWLDEESLSLIRRHALALVFPSIVEGFGLPVLEAMAEGVPVLTSNEGSLLEIAGDSAILVDPYDIQSIANGLKKLSNDKNLRFQLIKKGFIRAQKFSNEKYRENLYNFYNKF